MASETLASALDIFKTKSPSLIGVDIASTSLKRTATLLRLRAALTEAVALLGGFADVALMR